MYNSIKSSFDTSLGFPGLQGSSIDLSASISKSSSLHTVSFTVWVIPTAFDNSDIFHTNVFITSSLLKFTASGLPIYTKISLNLSHDTSPLNLITAGSNNAFAIPCGVS